jgi:hypothetical protein
VILLAFPIANILDPYCWITVMDDNDDGWGLFLSKVELASEFLDVALECLSCTSGAVLPPVVTVIRESSTIFSLCESLLERSLQEFVVTVKTAEAKLQGPSYQCTIQMPRASLS